VLCGKCTSTRFSTTSISCTPDASEVGTALVVVPGKARTLGEVLGIVVGDALGAAELGLKLVLGCKLGISLGPVLGEELGGVLGEPLGNMSSTCCKSTC
jgi:hypothetical protein